MGGEYCSRKIKMEFNQKSWDEKIAGMRARLGPLLREKRPPAPRITPPPLTDEKAVKALRDEELGQFIDHTLLKPEATRDQINQLCREAAAYRFASVCVNPGWVANCVAELKNARVGVATVIGFPLGATTLESKAFEARQAVELGA